jgi:restriction system protein
MAVPGFRALMLPLLRLTGDKKEHTLLEAMSDIPELCALSKQEKALRLACGHILIYNRVAWARTYLVKAGLLVGTKRGYFKITQKGIDVLKKNPSVINHRLLKQFPNYVEFVRSGKY